MNETMSNIYYLLKSNNKILSNRIKRELELLIKENICKEENIFVLMNDKYDLVIGIKKLDDKKYYEFIIPKKYPFVPPKLKINSRYLSFNHNIKSYLFSKLLIKYTGMKCFCCSTILCSYNWAPSLTFKHIFDDLNKFKNAAHEIVVRIIVDIIKRKYLMDDINIIEWLYI